MTKNKIDQRLKFPFPMRSPGTLGLFVFLYMPRGSPGLAQGACLVFAIHGTASVEFMQGVPVRSWLADQPTIAASLGDPCKTVKRAVACSGPGFIRRTLVCAGPMIRDTEASDIMKG